MIKLVLVSLIFLIGNIFLWSEKKESETVPDIGMFIFLFDIRVKFFEMLDDVEND